MPRRSRASRYLVALVAALVILGFREYSRRPARHEANAAVGSAVEREGTEAGARAIVAAFLDHRSGVWVESVGTVERTLPDDNEGSRHQRFILRLHNDHTVLISHNIDLAAPVPVSVGERVAFRGMYEWNDRGGVVHWTHHDPDGRRAGGWLEHQGRVVR